MPVQWSALSPILRIRSEANNWKFELLHNHAQHMDICAGIKCMPSR